MAKKKRKKKQGLSVTVMVVCLMVASAYICWAVASSTYFGAVIEPMEPRGPARRAAGLQFIVAAFITFLVNSFRLDAIPAVFMHSLRNHPWHFGLLIGLQAAAVLVGLGVKRLEAQLDRPLKARAKSESPVVPATDQPDRPRMRRKRPHSRS